MVYDPTALSTSAIQQVRWLLGGSRVDDLVTDDEIQFALDLNNDNIYLAGAECADNIGSYFSATSQRVVIGPFQSSDWQLKSAWDQLAKHLRRLGMRYSGLTAQQMLPGTSNADIEELDSQTEWPQFSFVKKMHDNDGTEVYNSRNWS